MSHELSINAKGEAEAYYAEKPAWHGLGTVLEQAVAPKEAMIVAGHNWTVEQRPLFVDGIEEPLPTHVANVRSDSNKVLGVVSPYYKPLQNEQFYEMIGNLLGEDVVLESAMALKGGRLMVATARLSGVFEVTPDDPLLTYLMFANGHDGRFAFHALLTKVRPVCWNTYMAARLGVADNEIFWARHSEQLIGRVEEMRKFLFGIEQNEHAVNEVMKKLAKTSVTKDQVTAFIDEMFPLPIKNNEEGEAKVSKRLLTYRETLRTNFEEHPFQQTDATRGTAYGLFNSVTQLVDHQMVTRGEDDLVKLETRTVNSWFGDGAGVKDKALLTLQQMYGIDVN